MPFIRAQNTYTTEASLHSGVTSLVLIPLSSSVEDIGPQLYGSSIGSAMLINGDSQVIIRLSPNTTRHLSVG